MIANQLSRGYLCVCVFFVHEVFAVILHTLKSERINLSN
ncbi:hypothetical protein P20495_1181 [Pseudoalteromonas sp. BSi20495]|nr:hypothetical protein P20495_1181 [Pseudoalteromonas sp. BSi20495]